MKKISKTSRERDVSQSIKNRHKKTPSNKEKKSKRADKKERDQSEDFNQLINQRISRGLNTSIDKKLRVTLILPDTMNFSSHYNSTINYINTIREFTTHHSSKYCYKLYRVIFSPLKKISTSAALVLTAELSRWDDNSRNLLKPEIDDWDTDILRRFKQLGFFNLFNGSPKHLTTLENDTSKVNLVQYIKGRCGDSEKTRLLKSGLRDIIGESIDKWTFLSGGVSEAITNVTHHAYPASKGYQEEDKYWYLTGAHNTDTRELKIVFYDQGVTIPGSLPASEVWERLLSALSKIPLVDRHKDETMLKAAVELERTSTGEGDRGKGLPDLLQFIKQRKNGYLSIISSKGLYKYSFNNNKEHIKTERFNEPTRGTLIIWKVTLDS
jgi:hypothetical protein